MTNLFNRRPTLALGALAAALVLGFTLTFSGTTMAMANSVADNIFKILKIGDYATIIQVDPSAEDQAKLNTEGSFITGSTKVSLKKDENSQPSTVNFNSLEKTQAAVTFKILTPEYLPKGYTFKEARSYEDSKEYIDLYYKGSSKDIILMQRLMNENTKYVMSSDKFESIDINGSTGAWIEPHTIIWEKDGIDYSLFCKGFSKEEAIKIAKSIK